MPKPLRRDQVPVAATFSTKRKKLPDFCLVQAWMAISHRVRSRIAELEPGRNQFFAFDVTRKSGGPVLGPDGEPLTTPYYLVNTTTRFDAIIRGLSVVDERSAAVGLLMPLMSRYDQLVYDAAMVAGHHFWEGIDHLRGMVMASDAFGDRILANKMRGCVLTKVGEATRP